MSSYEFRFVIFFSNVPVNFMNYFSYQLLQCVLTLPITIAHFSVTLFSFVSFFFLYFEENDGAFVYKP